LAQKWDVKPGDIFKSWEVIEEVDKRGAENGVKSRSFLCKCLKCGINYTIYLSSLVNPNVDFCCKKCNGLAKQLVINPGDIFKNWEVIEELDKKVGKDGKSRRYFSCKCLKCNNLYKVEISSLTNKNKSYSCVKCAHSNDLTGQKFGRLLVVSRYEITKNEGWKYNCECDCGSKVIVSGHSLSRNTTKSCGCLRIDVNKSNSGSKSTSWKAEKLDNATKKDYRDRVPVKLIRQRDNVQCQNCGTKKHRKAVHHIYDLTTYLKLFDEHSNLITLCEPCHKNFHSTYGTKTNTLNELETWMGEEWKYRDALIQAFEHYYIESTSEYFI
jgi:5-methylcytosine-specific restriction endonuclease McrA